MRALRNPTTPKLLPLVFLGTAAQAQPLTQPATLERVTYGGKPAFRLSDGRSAVVIAPSLGRVMHYGLVNGPNLLWNAEPGEVAPTNTYRNWGGDKTWLAPQDFWLATQPKRWPPDPAWDGLPHSAEVLPGARLKTISPLSSANGMRIIREYRLDDNGDLVIAQTVEKVRGEPRLFSIWSDTQAVWPDAVFLPLNPDSAYKNGFHWMTPRPTAATALSAVSPTLLMVRPTADLNYKIGVDAPVAALAAVKNGVAWVQRAAYSEALYPDGASGAGFPVELFNAGKSAKARSRFVELELLSPLRPFRVGTRWTHTMKWSLHRLSSSDVSDPAMSREMETLLGLENTKGVPSIQ